MIYIASEWSLADILWNYDPFAQVEHFGNVLNDYRGLPMSHWYCDAPDPINSI